MGPWGFALPPFLLYSLTHSLPLSPSIPSSFPFCHDVKSFWHMPARLDVPPHSWLRNTESNNQSQGEPSQTMSQNKSVFPLSCSCLALYHSNKKQHTQCVPGQYTPKRLSLSLRPPMEILVDQVEQSGWRGAIFRKGSILSWSLEPHAMGHNCSRGGSVSLLLI